MSFVSLDKHDYPSIPRPSPSEFKRSKKAPITTPSRALLTEAGKKERNRYLLRNYGIGLDHHDALLISQGGVCAICNQAPSGWMALHVDHCHATGRVRGLLCTHCNRGVGGFRDNPAWCTAAAKYLQDDQV